ncbi:hypothetical protein [Actinoplanes derwentensis]|uniref:Tfp pilus assembly protein PilF n=1 Tax=Actinoplanes derwentensis TaxID=113562 RepID=A0A1H1YLQ0_9ACTN|nr:hypothetical protein [Actinoplanes derwentensis]GID81198.1 hypothetical protein Ade03nite_01220 [Actinoplanes derwentensis]SDT22330.1 Tfp pilus assembly protein PilF [Actinoplanes derwentensis]
MRRIGGLSVTAIALLLAVRTWPGFRNRIAEGQHRAARPFLDRTRTRTALRRALWSRDARVIVVTGPAGVGKTELVTRVLEPFRLLRTRVVIHDGATATGRILDGDGTFDGRTRRSVIVIDSAQHLLDADGRLRDLALEEAFADRRGHKIVLVTDVLPQPRAGLWWLDPRYVIEADGLPVGYFKDFARRSAEGAAGRFTALDHRTQERLCGYFQGVPRLVQLFDAVVATSGITAADLAALIHTWARQDPADIPGLLLDQFVTGLNPDQYDLYRAVAALGVPAGPALIGGSRFGQEAIRKRLDELSPHAIHQVPGTDLYFVPEPEAERVLRQAPAQVSARAAQLLRDAGDPSAALAEVRAWLRAGDPIRAFQRIGELDDGPLPSASFRAARERLAEEIAPADQVENHNVLARLSQERGEFEPAWEHYQQALHLAGDQTRVRIRLNLAWLALARDDDGEALIGFEHVRDHPHADQRLVATALDGMARCLRLQGRFREALHTMTRAAELAEPWPGQWMPAALRLARLHSETGDLLAADHLVERASASHAAYYEALADLALARQDWPAALDHARRAVAMALPVNDSATLPRARTTICLALLRQDRWDQAAQAAALAERYRDPNQSLLALAVGGLAHRRANRPAESRAWFNRLLDATGSGFEARECEGLAYCAEHLDGDRPIEDAVHAFTAARQPPWEPAPRTGATILALVEILAADAPGRARLHRVFTLLLPGS